MEPAQLALWSLLAIALSISVVTDLVSRRILDVITLPALGLALLLRLWRWGLGDLEQGLVSGALAALGAMAVLAVPALRARMGWGDVKLVGAVGACLGYPLVLAALVFISVAGFAQAVVTLLWHGEVWTRLSAALRRLAAAAHLTPAMAPPSPRHIPYGIAIALGAFWAMWWGQHSGP